MPRDDFPPFDPSGFLARSHRLSAAYELWQGKRGERAMPEPARLDPRGLPVILKPWTILTGVLREDGTGRASDFRYDWIGPGVVGMSRRDFTGCRLSELEHTRSDSQVWRDRATVVETRSPLLTVPPYIGDNHMVRRIVGIHLPLGGEDGIVEAIFTVVTYEGGPGPA